MKFLIIISYTLLLFHLAAYSQDKKAVFSKPDYYKSISSDDLATINNELKKTSHISIIEKNAYTGALLMKKAGLVSGLSNKLSLFKEGKGKLEEAIKKYSDNIEFRFLRLMIQENAPSFLNYNNNLEEDSKIIIKNLPALSSEVQQAIINYTKQSKVLQLHE